MLIEKFEIKKIKEILSSCRKICEIAHISDKYELLFNELIQNAIEHGNLEIHAKEKKRLLQELKFYDVVAEKEKLSDKKVTIEILESDNIIIVTIKDEGKGFNFQNYQIPDASENINACGRGLVIVESYKLMSEVEIEYIAPGNAVRITIKKIK